jgi:hypothetical protein
VELKWHDHDKTVFITILSVTFKHAAGLKLISCVQCQRFCYVVRITHSDTVTPKRNSQLHVSARPSGAIFRLKKLIYTVGNAY